MCVSHEEFRSTRPRRDGDRVGRRLMLGELIMGATSPVRYPRHGDEGGRHLVRVRLDGVAVVAPGA
jgi:hypothetical protein